MEKNGEYKGVVCAIGNDGEGIVKCEGTTVFVPYCLTGEKINFKVLKVMGSVAYGKLTEVNSISPDREIPPCPVYEKCGGCQLQHMKYPAQLAFKKDSIKSTLKKLGGLDVDVLDVVAADKPLRYRNKLALPVSSDDEGNNLVGFYAQRSHRIVPIQDCLIQSEWIRDIILALRRFMSESGIGGYNQATKKGVIRQIVVREIKGKYIITLVVTKVIKVDLFIKELDNFFKDYNILLNVNTSEGNAIFSDEWHLCKGEGYFTAEEFGIIFKAGAETFIQVNDGVREKLYSAVRAAAKDKDAVVLDLYSGGGLLTAMLAKNCKRAYGIELVKEANICADELMKINSLQGKMINICGKVEEKLAEVISETAGEKKIVVCDPPRKGMERSVIYEILKAMPERIVLVSCNPATLARDMGLLLGSLKFGDNGMQKTENFDINSAPYKVESVTPFDMFPQTKHCECVVVLTKNKS